MVWVAEEENLSSSKWVCMHDRMVLSESLNIHAFNKVCKIWNFTQFYLYIAFAQTLEFLILIEFYIIS